MTQAAARQRHGSDTADQILDAAEHLVQVRGFNAFSYADVAAELGLTKPALHYHFASKAELGEALIRRYSIRFLAALAEIDDRGGSPPQQLEAYSELYAAVLRNQRMCLCGMLAAEYTTLSAGMQDAVACFFEENERWLAGLLQRGRDEGTLTFSGSALEEGRAIVSSLEGAMLVARSFGDFNRFQTVSSHLLMALHP